MFVEIGEAAVEAARENYYRGDTADRPQRLAAEVGWR